MARDNNTYAKRQRETLKRQKAQDKRERRQKRKDEPDLPQAPLTAESVAAEPSSDGAASAPFAGTK